MVHEFIVGVTSQPQFENINVILHENEKKLKNLGYQPEIGYVLCDIDDE